MKILFVSAVLPYPLYSGGQVRIYNLLKRLSKNHEITLCAFIRTKEEERYISQLSFCKKVIPILRGRAWQPLYVLRTLWSIFPFLYVTYDHAVVRKLLENEIRSSSFDLIHIEPGYVYPSIPRVSIPIVVAEHNIEHTVYKGYVKSVLFSPLRILMNRDIGRMISWEKRIWNTASSVITVSAEDKSYVKQSVSEKKISVVENGVDINYFTFSPKKNISKNALKFIFVGNFSWMQNSDALRFIFDTYWNAILTQYPGSEFRVIGRHLSSGIRQILPKATAVIESVEDIRNEYVSADILLAPIRIGGGTRYKILEAMATGLPVITSTLGASGLRVLNKKELYIADTVAEVLGSIHSICTDKLRLALVVRARQLIESEYSWDRIAARQDAVWRLYEK